MKRRSFVASVALMGVTAQAQVTDLPDAINKAGRQRMLSQRMVKAYLALAQGVEAAAAQQILDRSVALFDRQLTELKAYAPSADIKATYLKLESFWSDFKGTLVGTVAGKEKAAMVLDMDARILGLANQGTQQYESVYGKSVGKLVNLAGRQRMLSQRMAKFYLANALPVDAQSSATEIGKSRSEFLAALEILRKAPEATTKIKDELALADGQWLFFDQALQRRDGARSSAKHMSDVFVTSENLLTVMDRVTALYSSMKA